MAGPGRFAPERLAGVKVDPELVMMVIDDIAAGGAGRGRDGLELITTSAAAYVEYMGIEAEPGVDALDEQDLLVIMALTSRVTALSGLIETGHLDHKMPAADPDALEKVAAAACAATLLHRDERPCFQLLDFLAHLERAEREGGPW